ncbi:MAG TPA: hypothetical protein VJT82_02385, partial [Pyrinomonadaceae bacterium]|nr:hypothetical protein [Pyrinomonadaceae bacterium]
ATARDAEHELSLFEASFAPVMPASVPTESLRARLDEAIADLQPTRQVQTPTVSPVRAFFASVAAFLTTFTPRQATAFASLLVAVALAVVFVVTQQPDGTKEIAQVNQPAPPAPAASTQTSRTQAGNGDTQPTRDAVAAVPNNTERRPVYTQVKYEKAGVPAADAARTPKANAENAPAATANEAALPDEKTYLTSIASLTSVIESQGAQAMTPTLRAEYERNLAVVNQAIVASRVAARRNPQDDDAKEFLRSAYQNKVELLSAVADQAQIASARD